MQVFRYEDQTYAEPVCIAIPSLSACWDNAFARAHRGMAVREMPNLTL
jgi:hypothetical protein